MHLSSPPSRWITPLLLAALVTVLLGSSCLAAVSQCHASSMAMAAVCQQEAGAGVPSPLHHVGHDTGPCCPGSSTPHEEGDHCHDCHSCPCHAPLAMAMPRLHYVASVQLLSSCYLATPPSDVYLAKFVPPQNPA